MEEKQKRKNREKTRKQNKKILTIFEYRQYLYLIPII